MVIAIRPLPEKITSRTIRPPSTNGVESELCYDIRMTEHTTTISITTGTIVKAMAVIAAAWALYELRDLALIVLTSITLASAIEPGVVGFMKRGLPRVFSILLLYVMLFGVFSIIFFFFLPTLFADFASFVSSMPQYLEAFSQTGAFDGYAHILGVSSPSALSSADFMSGLRNTLSLGSTFSNAFSAISAIFGGVFSFILIIVFSFYFAVLETGVDDFLRIVVPKSQQRYMLGLWRRSQTKIGLWMQGQLLLGVIMGVLIYLGLMIFGVPHALVLAVIAAVFEIIPVFGPTLSAVPALGVAFGSGGVPLGIKTLVLYVIGQQFENHLIYPLVVTRVVGVPPILVILALLAGWELAGFLGVILSVPLAAIIQEIANDISKGTFMAHEK